MTKKPGNKKSQKSHRPRGPTSKRPVNISPQRQKARKQPSNKKPLSKKGRKRQPKKNINITGTLKKYLLPNFPYMVMGWFANKVSEAYHLSTDHRAAYRMLETLPNLSITLANFMPSFYLMDLFIGLLGGLIFYGIVWNKKKTAKKWRHDVEYGSARWGKPADIAPYLSDDPDDDIILTATESLTMNSRPKKPKYARNKNVLVIGGSGSGKTRFFIKPNIMQCISKSYPTSIVCTDPKGQTIYEVASLLKRKKYKIKVINTIEFGLSLKYNPFHYIRSEKDILKFVTAFMENTQDSEKKGGDPFWEKAESLLYQALIGYIYYQSPKEDKNINTMVNFVNSMRVNENDDNHKNAVDVMFEELEFGNPEKGTKPQPDHFAVRQYAKFRVASGKTLKSIIAMAGSRLSVFDIQEVRELMSDDELELDMIGDEKTALFVIVSDTDDSFNFIPAIMYSQLFNLLCDRADTVHGGRLPIHVRFLLDEFANRTTRSQVKSLGIGLV